MTSAGGPAPTTSPPWRLAPAPALVRGARFGAQEAQAGAQEDARARADLLQRRGGVLRAPPLKAAGVEDVVGGAPRGGRGLGVVLPGDLPPGGLGPPPPA